MMEERKKCLIIDDDHDDHEIFIMCVDQINAGIDCLAVSDGIEALDMLSSNETYTPDYIFIDMNMPKINGIECLRRLKSIARLDKSKVFMYSTTSQSSAVKDSIELGANDFIVKPSQIQELKDKLSQVFALDRKEVPSA